MKVYIGTDHAGIDSMIEIKEILESLNIEFEDLGSQDRDAPDDYPDFAVTVCEQVIEDEDSFGILLCGSGTGMVMVANKIPGIRAALCYDKYSAKMARLDNDANVLCLRSREFDHSKYYEIVRTFLETHFSGEERHKRRIMKITMLDMSKEAENEEEM